MSGPFGDVLGSKLATAAILVVAPEAGTRDFLTQILTPHAERVVAAASAGDATRVLDTVRFDLILIDNALPDATGINWVQSRRRAGLFAETILMSAHADIDTAMAAMRAGFSDLVAKPFRSADILKAASRALERKRLQHENDLLRHRMAAECAPGHGPMIGSSPAMEKIRQVLDRLALVSVPVLFTGESGTGKEIAARCLHDISDRAHKPFVAVNCGAVAGKDIAEALFGHAEGGDKRGPGLFLLAEGGSLFLDEVATMSPRLQSALLRVIEEKRVRPVAGARDIPLDVRFLFSTNENLEKAVAEGRFRADLYHRLAVVTVDMPPLRDRAEDVVELADHFMDLFSRALGMPRQDLDAETLLQFRRHDWPGNVRELRNLIERWVILGSVPDEIHGPTSTRPQAG
ncbi:MAG: sigma-54-dependent transcriptional regulator, partial [Marinibacterium sp.]